jgi:hypothetical protein
MQREILTRKVNACDEMEDVIDLTCAEEAVPARAFTAEPIGINVCADVVDLCESDDDGLQELHKHTLPQHLDWDDIAERRAANSAVQSLSALPQPDAAGVKTQGAFVVVRLTNRNAGKRKENTKGKGKRAASHALDEKSPQQKKKRKMGDNTNGATTNDRKKDNRTKRKKSTSKPRNENPLRQNKKKKKKTDGMAKKQDPASVPRNTQKTLTIAPNTGLSRGRKPEGALSTTERNRRKRQRAKENKQARAQNYATFKELNGEPPLSRDGQQSNPADHKPNAGEENLSHHVASISDGANHEHNLEPRSLVQLASSSQKHGVPLCHNVSDPNKSPCEHDPVPINREIRFDNQHEVYVDGTSQNCKPPASFVIESENESSPAHTASISSVFTARSANEKPAKGFEHSWRLVPPKVTTGRQTLKRAGDKTFKYCAHCPTKGRFKGRGMWTRHFTDEHNKDTKDNGPQVRPAGVEARKQVLCQSGAQETSVLDRGNKAPSLSNHVEAAATIKADRDGRDFEEEHHDDTQEKSNENGQTISDTDPDPVARGIKFYEQPEVFASGSSQSYRPEESFEVKLGIEATSAEAVGILSASPAPNDLLQKEQLQSGAQKTSVLDQKDEDPSFPNHVEITDTAEVSRAGHGRQDEHQDDANDTAKEDDTAVPDTAPDQVGKEMNLENETDVYCDSSSQNCKPPSNFEVKHENETSSAEHASISFVSAAPRDPLEKVHHQLGTYQTPLHYQNDKASSSSNHVEEADYVEADRASLECKGKQHDPAIPDTDERESVPLNQWHVRAGSDIQGGRDPLCCNVNERKVSTSVSLDDKLEKHKNQTNWEHDEVLAQDDESPVWRTNIDNETISSSEMGRTYQETKELPHVDSNVTLNDRRTYSDSRDHGVVSDESRSTLSGAKEQNTRAVYIRNDPVSEKQGSPHESHDSSPDVYVDDDGSVVFVKETQANVKPVEKATKLPTGHCANTIGLSSVGSPDRRANSRKRPNESMAFSEESLNAKSCPSSGHGSSLRDLIRNNRGKGTSVEVKKPAPPSFEGKSWRSTVIIIDSSDEDAPKHDTSYRKGVGRTSATTGIGSSNKNRSFHQGFWEASPPEISAARKPAARKRAKKPSTYNAEYYNSRWQYNFSFTETEAHREQERLLREAAARVRQGLAMNVSRPAPFVADADIPNISKLNENHWQSKDPYTCLGLPRGASINIIKSRYRRLALKYHPDKSNFVHTTARFQAVTEAYKLLTGMG